MNKTFLILFAFFALITAGYAQKYPGANTIGLGIEGITSSPNISLKMFFTDTFAGMVIAGADIDFQGGESPPGQVKVTGVELRAGLAFMLHFTDTKLTPFLGIQGIYENKREGGFFNLNAVPESRNSISPGIIFGIDYFPFNKMSIGIKETLGANIIFSRKIPSQSMSLKLSTNTVLTARFYF